MRYPMKLSSGAIPFDITLTFESSILFNKIPTIIFSELFW